MDPLTEEIRRLCKELAFRGILLTPANQWLVSCVDCYREEVKAPGEYTATDLFDFVYGQWLLADLNEVSSRCLPAEKIASDSHIVGRFAVQINYALNVSVSCHKQYQKLCRPESVKNLEVDGEGKKDKEAAETRALKLELTDGVSTVIAFEDKPCPNLEFPAPGEKLLLKGKIEVRKGVLMLTSKNVETLGGEVDTLLIPNAPVNVLARKLGLPENPHPYGDFIPGTGLEHSGNNPPMKVEEEDDYDDEFLRRVGEIETQTLSQRSSSVNRPPATSNSRGSAATEANPTPPVVKSSLSMSSSSSVQSKRTNFVTQPSQSVVNGFDFADDFDDIDMAVVDSVLQNIESPQDVKKPVERPKPAENRSNYYNRFDDDPVHHFKAPTSTIDLSDDEKTTNDPVKLKKLLEANYPSAERESWPPTKYPCERTIDAEVILIGKLKLTDGRFRLSGRIKCHGHEFDVDFSPEVLDKVFSLTAAEVLAKKNEARNSERLKEQINRQLKESQRKISSLSAKMIVKFASASERAAVVDVIE